MGWSTLWAIFSQARLVTLLDFDNGRKRETFSTVAEKATFISCMISLFLKPFEAPIFCDVAAPAYG
jgi:hypothetical protein